MNSGGLAARCLRGRASGVAGVRGCNPRRVARFWRAHPWQISRALQASPMPTSARTAPASIFPSPSASAPSPAHSSPGARARPLRRRARAAGPLHQGHPQRSDLAVAARDAGLRGILATSPRRTRARRGAARPSRTCAVRTIRTPSASLSRRRSASDRQSQHPCDGSVPNTGKPGPLDR
jgi:hypothetical protein